MEKPQVNPTPRDRKKTAVESRGRSETGQTFLRRRSFDIDDDVSML